jgi:hypothetical protein
MLALEGADEHAGASASQLPRELTAGAILVRKQPPSCIESHHVCGRRWEVKEHRENETL